jgi:hypothetical protein
VATFIGGRPAAVLACPDRTREETPGPRDDTALPRYMRLHRTYRLGVERRTGTDLKDVEHP